MPFYVHASLVNDWFKLHDTANHVNLCNDLVLRQHLSSSVADNSSWTNQVVMMVLVRIVNTVSSTPRAVRIVAFVSRVITKLKCEYWTIKWRERPSKCNWRFFNNKCVNLSILIVTPACARFQLLTPSWLHQSIIPILKSIFSQPGIYYIVNKLDF